VIARPSNIVTALTVTLESLESWYRLGEDMDGAVLLGLVVPIGIPFTQRVTVTFS